jgi:hypothetical protein
LAEREDGSKESRDAFDTTKKPLRGGLQTVSQALEGMAGAILPRVEGLARWGKEVGWDQAPSGGSCQDTQSFRG